MKYARAKRAKILFFVVKYANLWGFCCRRRRGCFSSLLGSLNYGTATTTPQIKDLIGRVTNNERTARAARIFRQVLQNNSMKLPHLRF